MFTMGFPIFTSDERVFTNPDGTSHSSHISDCQRQFWENPQNCYVRRKPTVVRLKLYPVTATPINGKDLTENLVSHVLKDVLAPKKGAICRTFHFPSETRGGCSGSSRAADAYTDDKTSFHDNGYSNICKKPASSPDKQDSSSSDPSNNWPKVWMTAIELRGFAPHEVKVTVKDGMVHVAAKHEETSGPGPCISKYVVHRTVAVPPYACAEKVACLMLPSGQLLMYSPPRRDAAPMADEPGKVAGEEASTNAFSADSEDEHQENKDEESDKNRVSAGGKTTQETLKVIDAIEEQKIDYSVEADASNDSSLEIEANDQLEKAECCDNETNESRDGVQDMDGHEHHDPEETCVLHFDDAVDVLCNSSYSDNTHTSLDTHADGRMSNARAAYKGSNAASKAVADDPEETQTVSDDCKDDAREATHEQADPSLKSTSQPCQDDTHMVVNEESQHTAADDSEETILDDLKPTSGNCSTGSAANPYTTREQKMTEFTDVAKNNAAGNDQGRDVPPPAMSCEWAATDPTRPIKRAQFGTVSCVADPGHKDLFIASFPLANFRPEDISVTVSGNMLVITAEFDNRYQDVIWKESITRKMELPTHLDLSSIKCQYHHDGQLTVTALSNTPVTDL